MSVYITLIFTPWYYTTLLNGNVWKLKTLSPVPLFLSLSSTWHNHHQSLMSYMCTRTGKYLTRFLFKSKEKKFPTFFFTLLFATARQWGSINILSTSTLLPFFIFFKLGQCWTFLISIYTLSFLCTIFVTVFYVYYFILGNNWSRVSTAHIYLLDLSYVPPYLLILLLYLLHSSYISSAPLHNFSKNFFEL